MTIEQVELGLQAVRAAITTAERRRVDIGSEHGITIPSLRRPDPSMCPIEWLVAKRDELVARAAYWHYVLHYGVQIDPSLVESEYDARVARDAAEAIDAEVAELQGHINARMSPGEGRGTLSE